MASLWTERSWKAVHEVQYPREALKDCVHLYTPHGSALPEDILREQKKALAKPKEPASSAAGGSINDSPNIR